MQQDKQIFQEKLEEFQRTVELSKSQHEREITEMKEYISKLVMESKLQLESKSKEYEELASLKVRKA